MRLAFDVCDQVSTFSWQTADGLRHHRVIDSGRATEILLPTLRDIQNESGETLSALGVVSGPGSFTGIRVGLATAMGLQRACNIPVFGFNKFTLVASQMDAAPYVLVLPAGKREVILTPVSREQGRGEPQIRSKEQFQPEAQQVTIQAIEGLNVRALELNLTNICLDLMAGQPDPKAYPLEPLYLRPPDAKKNQTLLARLLAQI